VDFISLQQSLSDKGFKKGQTLSYLNGYQREETIAVVKELEGSPATGSPAAAGGAAATLSESMLRTGSPSKLPQWVENDRKVRLAQRQAVPPCAVATSMFGCRLYCRRVFMQWF
jgi:hypothetical protein